MRVERLSQRAARSGPIAVVLRHGWKIGFALLAVVLVMARSASEPRQSPVHISSQRLGIAGSLGPTIVPCTPLSGGTTTWNAEGSPYILPSNNPSLGAGDAAHPNCLTTGGTPDDLYVPVGATLVIDATDGPVQIFSHGTGITVQGGQIQTAGTGVDAANIAHTVTFDAEPDVAAWDGIKITTGTPLTDPLAAGTGQFDYTSIQHALTSIQIDSGATSLSGGFGLIFTNGGIGPSYFDGIDSTNTPVQLVGQTGPGNGRFGTVNNIGSQGLKITFNSLLALPGRALDVRNEVFGSSVAFADTTCVPLQPCAAGTIGNDAIQANFLTGQTGVVLSGNQFFRAGSYGVEMHGASSPVITSNGFTCNGSGSATPVTTCTGTGLKYSAMYLDALRAALYPFDTADNAVGVHDNRGQQNGLDATVMNGTITKDFTWVTPTTDSDSSPTPPVHKLGYMVANGDLQILNSKLTVNSNDVVKVAGGAIKLNNATLWVLGSAPGRATFTSLRDANTTAVDACGSVFAQNCPVPLPSNEWSGLSLAGANTNANINYANILYASTGLNVVNGAKQTLNSPSYGVVMTNSFIGRTLGDGVDALNTPILLADNVFGCAAGVTCLGPATLTCPPNATCVGPATGDRGVMADFSGAPLDIHGAPTAIGGGLQLLRNTFLETGSQGILAVSLGGQKIDIENNTVDQAGLSGIELRDAQNPKLLMNNVTNSGLLSPSNPTRDPAIWLNNVSQASFLSQAGQPPACPTPLVPYICGNGGGGNGLDAIGFHGSTTSLKWISPTNRAANAVGTAQPILGYFLDDALTVNGDLTLAGGDYVPVLRGNITVAGGKLVDSGATVTSLRQRVPAFPTCGSVFMPAVNGTCPDSPGPGDFWGGFNLDPSFANSVSGGSMIQFAATGLLVRAPAAPLPPAPQVAPSLVTLQFSTSTVQHVTGDAIHTFTPLSIVQGAFSDIGGNGVDQDLTGLPPPAGSQALSVDSPSGSNTTFTAIGQAAIVSRGLDGLMAEVSNTRIAAAATYGINLESADDATSNGLLTVINNDIADSGKPLGGKPSFPAIYVNGFRGPASSFGGNTGARNGLNALVFHGTVTTALTWVTARNAAGPLGYLVDGDLNITNEPPAGLSDLTVSSGDIVKVKGSLTLAGGAVRADSVTTASTKVFTSLTDDSAGIPACHSILMACSGSAAVGDWSGIVLSPVSQTVSGSGSDFVNAAIRYAGTGIADTSRATGTANSLAFGLTVSRTAIGPSKVDGINAVGTPVSVTDSKFVNLSAAQAAQHGVAVDFTDASLALLRISNTQFNNTQAEAVVGRQLSGHTLWITDNHIQNAGTFGIRLPNADQIVLRNNNISASGNGAGGPYPAIDVTAVTSNFSNYIRGNVGQGDGINAIVFDGQLTGDLQWVTPPNALNPATLPLGYMLSGPVTLDGGKLSLKEANPVVKGLGGPITISGGTLDGAGATGTITFSSIKDPGGSFVSCPSFLSPCGAAPGDWGGLVLTGSGASGSLDHSFINYSATGVSIDSGTIIGGAPMLTVKNSRIVNTKKDGINSVDTPLDVEDTYVGDPSLPSQPNIGGHGIIASFFSPPAKALTLLGNHIASTGSDGIAANGLAGNPVDVETNTISDAHTYGILLVGADQLRMTGNTVNTSGGPNAPLRYPAYYLNGVKADFEAVPASLTVAANAGSGNGIDALMLHGEATKSLSWFTTPVPYAPLPAPAPTLGYMLDGPLTVDGNLTTNPGDVVKALGGGITVTGNLLVNGTLVNGVPTTAVTTFTSLGDSSVPLKACDDKTSLSSGFSSPFVQQDTAGKCPVGAGDWKGITVQGAASVTNATIAYDDGLTVKGGALQFASGAMHDISSNAIVASGYPVSIENVGFSRVGGDAIDSANSGSSDQITDDQFDHVSGYAIRLTNAPADLERNIFTNDASPAVSTSGGAVTLRCSSIQSGGVQGDNSLTVSQSDFSSGVGVNATTGANVDSNWWGQGTGPSIQQLVGVQLSTATSYLASQNPIVTIATVGVPSAAQLPDTNRADAHSSIGTGFVQATLAFSREMNTTDPLDAPVVTYGPAAMGFNGDWKANDPKTWVGKAPIAGQPSFVGSYAISAAGAHDCVPPSNSAQGLMTPSTNSTFYVDTSTIPLLSLSAADHIGASGAELHGHIDPNGWATSSGQFVLTNVADSTDKHTVAATPSLADKTTGIDVDAVATGLTVGATYGYKLDILSANGTASLVSATNLALLTPSKVVITAQPPATVAAGASFGLTVQIQDGAGTLVADDTDSVTLDIDTNPSSGTLAGTSSVAAVGGIATFTGLSINNAGDGYQLTAADGSLLPATSVAFTVTASTTTALSSAPTTPYPATPTVTITATIAAPSAISPGTGSVKFMAAGNSISTACDTAAVTSGQASCIADYSAVNGNDLTAHYTGGTTSGVTYTDSDSPTLQGTTVTVSQPSAGTFMATVQGGPSGNGDGNVQFVVGGTVICDLPIASGSASCTPNPALTAGTDVWEIYTPAAGSSFASSDKKDTA